MRSSTPRWFLWYQKDQQLVVLCPVGRSLALLSDTEEDDSIVTSDLLQGKQRRRARARPRQGDREEPPTIRGLWVQEVDWSSSAAEVIPPPAEFTDPCSHEDGLSWIYESFRGLEDQDRPAETRSDSDLDSECLLTHESETDSSCSLEEDARGPHPALDLMHVSGFNSSPPPADQDSAGPEPRFSPGPGDEAALDQLRGRVSQKTKLFVSPFFRDLSKQTGKDWKPSVNEGLLFHPVSLTTFTNWSSPSR